MYLAIVGLPGISFLVGAILGRRCGRKGISNISSICILLASVLSIIGEVEVVLRESPVSIKIMRWVGLERMDVEWGLLFDGTSMTMAVVVLSISGLVHMYSNWYLEGDAHKIRYLSYISLFTWMMLIMVTADNYILMFVGWEGIGLSSYLLINYWYRRVEANKSSMKALLMNRVGDWGLTIGILYIYMVYENVDYNIINGMGGIISEGGLKVMTIYILIGAIAKSAQIGLHTWLPNAMEAPTPVSALLHAATLVTAGVYVIIRTSPILEMVPSSMIVISGLGGLTALYGAIAGIYQNDIKRIIAYSTCSQLGYMVLACGVSQYSVALYHLLNHAYFKALLFLSAGCIIHGLGDEQDVRKMGGIMRRMPMIYVCVLIGSLSLMALPYLSGYYSKDMILEVTKSQMRLNGKVTSWLGMITATITSLYTIRMILFAFGNKVNGRERIYSVMIEEKGENRYEIPLILLAIGSIFMGYITKEIFIGVGSTLVSGVYINPMNKIGIEIEEIKGLEKVLPLIATLMGGVIYVLLRRMRREEEEMGVRYEGRWLSRVVGRTGRGYDWWDNIYNGLVISGGSKVAYVMAKNIDKGIVELIGPLGLRRVLGGISRRMMELDSGYILHYGLYIVIGALIIITLLV